MESIVDYSSNKMNLTTRILEHLIFDHLTRLGLCINKEWFSPRSNATKALFKATKNVPALEALKLTHALAKAVDLEVLHAGATKLKHLRFDQLSIFDDDVEEEVEDQAELYYPPVESFKSFAINHVTAYEAIGPEIRAWIVYIGHKYPQLQDLDIESRWPMETEEDYERVVASLTRVVTNMKHLERN